MPDAPSIEQFIRRWQASSAAERANYQLFLSELCDQLEVPRPDPSTADNAANAYVFERAVTFRHGDGTTSTGSIDLYKRGCFVLEAKQGSDTPGTDPEAALLTDRPRLRRGTARRGTSGWDDAMLAARGQAEQYVRALPDDNPPFVVVVDVGHSIELYSDFSRLGKTYTPFPDARSHRIFLPDLAKPELRDRLRRVWLDPLSLDPARRTAKVTRDIAARLAELAKSLERSGHDAESVATFLMRCLFTLFAEDVDLIPKDAFKTLLASLQGHVEKFPAMARAVWSDMNTGGFSVVLREHLLRFNGGLFADTDALPLTETQLALLIDAAKADWRDVEPAIFGTLLERALDPLERHKLGAHYTPRAYVERLVLPTIIEPLREEWAASQAAAVTLAKAGKRKEAIAEVQAFLDKLCDTTVLDPACGSGNFLYVTLEHMKRLEGEIRDVLHQLGESQDVLEHMGMTVDPHQLRGIEINPRAAAIADLVLWIGYLQWHFRTRGHTMPAEPVLKKFDNIECRDAVLAYDRKEVVVDDKLQPVTRWDGRTMKKHPVTGEDVPDETARVLVYRYANPRKAEWPKADYVVGNPPFVGAQRIRDALGDGYAEALWDANADVPRSSDLVMFWWHKAAELLQQERVRRFGFITTNSITQEFNRRLVDRHLQAPQPLSIVYAIPDHPWVDSADGAAVRIAMTCLVKGTREGRIETVQSESDLGEERKVELASTSGCVLPNLRVGAATTRATELLSNSGICHMGVKLHGEGFLVTPEQADQLGLGHTAGLDRHIRPFRSGRDVAAKPRGLLAIDLFGLTEAEVRTRYPAVYQWVLGHVKPERDQNNRASYRDNWWIFGEPRSNLRPAIARLRSYIATTRTGKHRVFQSMPVDTIPESEVVTIAIDDPFALGVLSGRVHTVWALATGGRMGMGNDPRYNHSLCFNPFPFPTCTDAQKQRIRELGEALDAHRKRQQAAHPGLTITDMYNVLEKLRSGEAMIAKDKKVHEQGLISVLKQIHDDLDAAVFEAYGWPATLTDEEILEKLVALNAERAAEEARGIVRWLRPEFQNPQGAPVAVQGTLELEERTATSEQRTGKGKGRTATGEQRTAKKGKAGKQAWPATLAEQARVLRAALANAGGPVTPGELAKCFTRARVERVEELLDTLVSLGQAREIEEGRYTG